MKSSFLQGIALLTGLLAMMASTVGAATYDVDRNDDTLDSACTAAPLDCSLRGAIKAANANAGADTINLQNGVVYTLSLGGADSTPGSVVENSGDLDVTDSLTLNGNNASVNANGIDRAFDVVSTGSAVTVVFNNLTVTGGHPLGYLSFGGGINVRGAALTLNSCIVTNNTTSENGSYDNGGGIAVNSIINPATAASLTLTNSTVSNNQGGNGGGIVLGGSSTATIQNSTVSGNTGNGAVGGGGLFVAGFTATASITQSTVAVNTATGSGGGLNLYNAAATVSHGTIALNNANLGGGAFPNGGTSDGGHLGVLSTDTSLWANSATGPSKDIAGALTSSGYNLFQSTSGLAGATGNDLQNVSAQLAPTGLHNNGGPTLTILPLGISPAHNGGDPAYVNIGNDQRGAGYPRVVEGRVDIGAVELIPLTADVAPGSPTTISENAGANATTVRITRTGDLTNPLFVTLRSSDTTEATVQPSVTIPAFVAFVDVPVNAVDDSVVDGTQTVQIKATAPGVLPIKANIDVTDDDVPTLTVRVAPGAVTEGAVNAATFTITHNLESLAAAVDLTLSSNDARVGVPGNATIPAGSRNVTVPVSVSEDDTPQGATIATLGANAGGFIGASAPLTVYDNDTQITLTLAPGQPATISEGPTNTTTMMRITRNGPTAAALVVNLSFARGAGQVTIPSTATIPIGASFVDFTVTAVDDPEVDGKQTVVIRVVAAGYRSDSCEIYVTDNDGPSALFSPFAAPETPSK